MLAPQSECVKILRYERNLFRQYVKVDISKPEISYLVVENKEHCTLLQSRERAEYARFFW